MSEGGGEDITKLMWDVYTYEFYLCEFSAEINLPVANYRQSLHSPLGLAQEAYSLLAPAAPELLRNCWKTLYPDFNMRSDPNKHHGHITFISENTAPGRRGI